MYGRRLLVGVLTVLTLVGGASVVSAQTPPRARLGQIVGTVKIQRGGKGPWLAADSPAHRALYAGDHVQTYQRSRATVLIDGARVSLGPQTEVGVPLPGAKQAPAGRSRIWTIAGRVFIWLVGARDLEIGTAGAVAAARGTKFVLEVGPEGATVLTVVEGEVEFYNDVGSVMVGKGEQSTASPGTRPTRPKAVDLSQYLEWEASLENVWMGFEMRHFPGEPLTDLQKRAEEARKQAGAAPNDLQAQLRAGDLLHDSGDLAGADAAYRRALGLAPDDAAHHVSLGYNLLAQGNRVEAVAEFERTAQLAPTSAAPLIGQAIGLISNGTKEGNDRADAVLKRACALEPANSLAYVATGLLAMRRGDAGAARAALQHAIELDRSAYLAHSYLAAVALAEGDTRAALESARQAVQLAQSSAVAHESLAATLFFTGALAEARREAALALEANDNSATAHLLSAEIYVAGGDFDRALEEAQVSVTLDPTLSTAYSLLGMISLAQNDYPHAERAFTKALALSPNLAAARTGLGATYARQGRLKAALDAQQAAISLDANLASAHNNLGSALLARGRLKEAVAAFETAAKLEPSWAMPHANLALAGIELFEYDKAVREAQRAVRLGDDSARTHTTLARVYLKQNRTNAAWAELRRALELDQNYALAHLEIAEVYVRLGRSRDARREQLEAIALQPSSILESRAYDRTEVAASGGDSLDTRLRTEGRFDGGQSSYYAAVEHQQIDGDRPHSLAEQTTGVGVVGHQSGPDRTSALYVSAQHESQDVPGARLESGAPEDLDFRSTFNGEEAQLLARTPVSRDGHVTLKLGYRRSVLEDRNPDSLMPDPKPFRELELRSSGPLIEARLDQRFSSRHRTVAGAAFLGESRVVSGEVGQLNPPGSPEPVTWYPFRNEAKRSAGTFYLEHTARLDPHTSLMVGGRLVTAEAATPVLRPKACLTRQIGRDQTLVLLTRPVLRDDVSEISPVDHWALTDTFTPLSFAAGGFTQSYELQYQLLPRDGTVLRVSGFHRTLRNFIVALNDPQWATEQLVLFLPKASLQGGQIEFERYLTHELSAGVAARLTDSDNHLVSGKQIPFQPRWTAQARLDYLAPCGFRADAVWVFVGDRFADPANTQKVGSYDVVNLLLTQRYSLLHGEVFVVVNNLFDRHFAFWPGYPEPGREVEAGVLYRF